jgi:hypothetical protein
MRWLAGLVLAALPVAAWAEDASLGELRGMLVPMRKHPLEHLESRGAMRCSRGTRELQLRSVYERTPV